MLDKKNEWAADSVEIIEVGEVRSRENPYAHVSSISHIVKFKNLTVNPKGKLSKSPDPVTIKGDSFLASLHYFYHHSILDMMATYETIKQYVPGIKCYFNSMQGEKPYWRKDINDRSLDTFMDYIKTVSFGFKNNSDINQHEFMRDLVKIYSEDGLIYSLEADTITFENFYLLISLPTPIAEAYSNTRNIEMLSKKMISVCNEDAASPKKIYISRKLNNKRYKDEAATFGPTVDVPNKSVDIRVYENEDKIEKYFIDNGYAPVTLEGTSMISQLNLFYNATHIAGINGSGFVNLISSKSGTRVIELDVIAKYSNPFDYKSLYEFKSLNHSVYRCHSENIDDTLEILNKILDK